MTIEQLEKLMDGNLHDFRTLAGREFEGTIIEIDYTNHEVAIEVDITIDYPLSYEVRHFRPEVLTVI